MTNEKIATRIKAGEDELIPELWKQVRRYIAKSANRRFISSGGFGGVEVDDLIQSGYFAMIAAIGYYRPDDETRFLTYLKTTLKKAFAEAGGYRTVRGYNDPLQGCLSLDAPAGADADDFTLGDLQIDPVDHIEETDRRIWLEELHKAIYNALDELPDPLGEVMKARYIDGLTMEEAARRFGIQKHEVKKIEYAAFKRLRMNRAGLRDFADRAAVDRITPWYYSVGADRFNRTHSSAVEEIMFKREQIAQQLQEGRL